MEFKNMFMNDEFIEMAKKNMDFTLDLYKKNVALTEDMMKEKMTEYFGYVNTNIEFLTKNYNKAVETNTELADLYKQNAEKTYKMAEKMVQDIQNWNTEK